MKRPETYLEFLDAIDCMYGTSSVTYLRKGAAQLDETTPAHALESSFLFRTSEEGFDFWRDLADGLPEEWDSPEAEWLAAAQENRLSRV